MLKMNKTSFIFFFLGSIFSSSSIVLAQRNRRSDEQSPPGLQRWLGVDECNSHQRWYDFHAQFGDNIELYKKGDFQAAKKGFEQMTDMFITDPRIAFQCATAMAAAYSMLRMTRKQLGDIVGANRAQQHATIFGSFDFQMKGEQWIEESPWPFTWEKSVQDSIDDMKQLQQYMWQKDPKTLQFPQNHKAKEAKGLPKPPTTRSKLQIAIVGVCEYDNEKTPLTPLSHWNKKVYSDKHGYDLHFHRKGPYVQDAFSKLYTEPPNERPPAWSKIDGVIMAIYENKYDWVMWMDCDSYFMDQEYGIHDLIAEYFEPKGMDSAVTSKERADLTDLLNKWDSADGTQQTFDKLLESENSIDDSKVGWDKWLLNNESGKTELIVSEDGLMLNTGIFFARSTVWSWRFFQKVRRFTFGNLAPVTQHPWWEQTAMVYLLQMPFKGNDNLGYAPSAKLIGQKHINGYPLLVSTMLATHLPFDEEDYIISFSGCKIYSSESVCNALYLNYFDISMGRKSHEVPNDEVQAWLAKGERILQATR